MGSKKSTCRHAGPSMRRCTHAPRCQGAVAPCGCGTQASKCLDARINTGPACAPEIPTPAHGGIGALGCRNGWMARHHCATASARGGFLAPRQLCIGACRRFDVAAERHVRMPMLAHRRASASRCVGIEACPHRGVQVRGHLCMPTCGCAGGRALQHSGLRMPHRLNSEPPRRACAAACPRRGSEAFQCLDGRASGGSGAGALELRAARAAQHLDGEALVCRDARINSAWMARRSGWSADGRCGITKGVSGPGRRLHVGWGGAGYRSLRTAPGDPPARRSEALRNRSRAAMTGWPAKDHRPPTAFGAPPRGGGR